jgi:eukaryotic-like serine/threonine-protein kinase
MTLDRGMLLNGRYKIVDILGQGGMASIYRAVDENLNLEVAVKENLFTTEDYARQFRLEAVILASLRHPNMPRVTDHFVIQEQGQYLVMDYIEGEDLRQRMDRVGILPDEEVVVLGVAITEALIYLHSRTPPVIHRDIKPGNVKINPQGQVYLVDFGLAKVENEGQLTTTGARAMTPGYSPPEQYGTARTDHRTDIYSLGATLYSALTNALPEDGLARAMGQVGLTPIRMRNPGVSRRLASVIEKALEVHPEDRYQNAEEFQHALLNARSTSRRKAPLYLTLPPPPFEDEDPDPEEMDEPVELQDGPVASEKGLVPLPVSSIIDPVSKPRRRRKQRRRNIFTATVLFGFLFLIVGAAIFIRLPGFIAWGPFIPEGAVSTWTDTAGQISPLVPSTTTITPNPTDNSESIQDAGPVGGAITSTLEVDEFLTPTPDLILTATPGMDWQNQIAFASDRRGVPQIFIVNMDGTSLKQITNVSDGACQPDWAPDGLQLVFISPCPKYQESYPLSSMFIVNADGSNQTALPNVPGGDYDPAWSPDGKEIVFTSLRSGGKPKIYLLNLEDETVQLLADEGPINMQPAWSPDGKQIVFVTNRRGPRQVWFMNSDGSDQRLFSRSMDLMNSNPAWSPDGKVILFTQLDPNSLPRLVAASQEEDGFSEFPVTQSTDPMRDARYSSDNAWLVFESWRRADPNSRNIFVMTSSGMNHNQVTFGAHLEFHPVWRPNPRQP